MKVKTIKRHIIVLDDTEVKILYRALAQLEQQKSSFLNGNEEKVGKLKDNFYKIVKPDAYIKSRKEY